MKSREEHCIFYAKNQEIPYTLIRSDRRSISIKITAGASMQVRIPLTVRTEQVNQFLSEKSDWIIKHLAQTQVELQRAREQNPQLFEPASPKLAAKQKRLEKRYRELARTYITKRVDYYTALVGKSYSNITIRDQKTRWGSCSGRGTLSFNWRLILAPPTILDYVVVHEVCHLLHMDHSKAFWQSVENILPDYKISRTWLKQNGNRLAASYEPVPYSAD
ncbi:MAG: SprT family zinc-dependent metalloprotease [Lachnospiraceae bacterium]|nr:SprT family zinc-dependent metalloprotease [Lachnospiraceae bacterium]